MQRCRMGGTCQCNGVAWVVGFAWVVRFRRDERGIAAGCKHVQRWCLTLTRDSSRLPDPFASHAQNIASTYTAHYQTIHRPYRCPVHAQHTHSTTDLGERDSEPEVARPQGLHQIRGEVPLGGACIPTSGTTNGLQVPISMQSACGQHAIRMPSVCNQHGY